jgi:NAD(P)-dependent dehydrogenase (short-subunit alcohol dehydrogenase family)
VSAGTLTGRTALVTGAARGIGRAIALGLAEAGAEVILISRTGNGLEELSEDIRRSGGCAVGLTCDVTEADEVDRMMGTVARRAGGLDILVNNVGGAYWLRDLEQVDAEMFARGLALNVESTQHMMRAAAPLLFQRPGSAAVVNIASIAAGRGLERMSYYSAAKSAVIGLTRAAAREWGPRGVRVNCLAPGWVETDLSSSLRQDEDFYRKTLEQIPLGRWATAADIAPAAVFLAGSAAAYITGVTLFVDGGLLA